MKLMVGLGNPGAQYRRNRHNVGHMFVDFLTQRKFSILNSLPHRQPDQFSILKTTVFMNLSGPEVKKFIRKLSIRAFENLMIIHDDLDIPLGKFKIQHGAGPKLHNGIASIEEALGTKDFWRLRIGVDNRTAENWTNGETYVLSNFTKEERLLLEEIFPHILERLANLVNLRSSRGLAGRAELAERLSSSEKQND